MRGHEAISTKASLRSTMSDGGVAKPLRMKSLESASQSWKSLWKLNSPSVVLVAIVVVDEENAFDGYARD